MSEFSLKDLGKLIRAKKWVKGAVNYDEDLHFSSYYLRASCSSVTAPIYPGYSCLVAFFENFNETYYLLESECRLTAAAIVSRALRQPRWLPKVLEQIRRHSGALASIFPPETSPSGLARLPHRRLLSLYRRHDRCHRALYRYARLPEALDRGVSYFTGYLMEHLRGRGVAPIKCDEVFAALLQPVEPSVLSQEILEFDRIVERARSNGDSIPGLSDASARARMLLSADVLRRLNAHRERWQFLSYHGYGRRELTTLDQYVGRLVKQAGSRSPAGEETDLLARCEEARHAREDWLQRLGIDRAHRALFNVYPEIGAVKLYRRYAQLRNFYYLDMLLAEIAQRLAVSERTIRCMLPEEVIASLRSRRLVNPAIEARVDGCLYAVLAGRECIVPGRRGIELGQRLRARLQGGHVSGELRGVVACRGRAVGPCRVIIRADDYRGDFEKGTVLVSESTDPDLVRFLRIAGAVLTEQGGVTSHAAIICRELRVPTVIGIEGLLERVHDGDWVEVDAERGTVTLLAAAGKANKKTEAAAPPSLSRQAIGNKAYNLNVLQSLGFPVPEYVLLDYAKARRWVHGSTSRNASRLIDQAVAGLGLTNGDKLALRSSAVSEDREDGSSAGEYKSLLNISPDQLAAALREFVTSNRFGRNGTAYRGSVIIQRMIQADCAGVCLTRDLRARTRESVIIEMAAGGNEGVTGGSIRPDRVVVDRLTGDILEEERELGMSRGTAIDVAWMVRQFLTIEARVGKPLDIEWALAGRELYILQARPIVNAR